MRFMSILALCAAISGCTVSAPSRTAPGPALTAQAQTALGTTGRGDLNAIRAAAGLPALTSNPQLEAAARRHAADLARTQVPTHTGSDGSNSHQRIKSAGYDACVSAENISWGHSSRERAIEAWLESPGHYQNLVHRKVREYGLAQVGTYWVMTLAAKRC